MLFTVLRDIPEYWVISSTLCVLELQEKHSFYQVKLEGKKKETYKMDVIWTKVKKQTDRLLLIYRKQLNAYVQYTNLGKHVSVKYQV